MKKDLLQGVLYLGEALAAAGVLAVVNAQKANTGRGTFALVAKPDGTGGIDLDVAVGATLLLASAVAPQTVSPHLAMLGVGALAVYAERKGTAYGMARRKTAFEVDEQGNLVGAALPTGQLGQYSPFAPRMGFGSASGYRVQSADQWMGPVDSYAQGFEYAHPTNSSQTF